MTDQMREQWAALESAVKIKFRKAPSIITRLRDEGRDKVWYRVFWKDEDHPSTVIVVGWNGSAIRWITEAQAPKKGGNVLGETSVTPDDEVTRRLKAQLRESNPKLTEDQVDELFAEAAAQGRRVSESGPTRSTNQAVRAAYAAGQYTDKVGIEYRRGMDGWFADVGDGDGILLIRHHDFVALIEEEHP